MFDDVFVWMGKISGTGDDDKNKLRTYLLMQCTDHRSGQAWAAARASPIITPVSTSYLDFQELLNPAHN